MRELGFIGWSKPDYLNIKWGSGVATPNERIDVEDFMWLHLCSVKTMQGISFGSVKMDGQYWKVRYFFYNSYCVAAANVWCGSRVTGLENKSGVFIPRGKSFDLVEGFALGKDGTGYHAMRFYRVGCQHKNMDTRWEAQFERHDRCPDCEYHAVYDTSG